MMQFPFQQELKLEGQRVMLCGVHRAHSEAFFRLVDGNRDDLRLSFPVLCGEVISVSRARNWIAERRRMQSQGQHLAFVITSRDTGVLLGYLAAVHIEYRVPKCELAYFMDAAYRRQGLMQEALNLLLELLFHSLHFNKVLCRVAPENEASLRMLECIGFEREGLIRNDFRSGHGILGDCVYMGKLPPGQGV